MRKTMKIILCVMATITITACGNSQAAKFQADCETMVEKIFSETSIIATLDDAPKSCGCLYETASEDLNAEELDFLEMLFDEGANDLAAFDTLVEQDMGKAIESRMETISKSCGFKS